MTIQAEYQRMRLQQDMRQVRARHTQQLSAATLRADLAQTTLESTQLQLEVARKQTFHNAATTLQIGVCRSQAQHDMRELLGAHRAQMQQQDQKMEQLRSEMAQAEATHREEKDKLHAMKEDALTKLRDSNEAEVARLVGEHEERLAATTEALRTEHEENMAEQRASAAEQTSHLAGLLEKATTEHSASMSALQQKAADEVLPLSLEVETAAQEARDAHASVLQRQRAEIRRLKEENAALTEAAAATPVPADAGVDAMTSPHGVPAISTAVDAMTSPHGAPPSPGTPARSVLDSSEHASPEAQRTTTAAAQASARAKVIFRRFDEDADGFLNLGEMRELLAGTNPSSSERIEPEEFGQLCATLGCSDAQGLDLPSFARMYQEFSGGVFTSGGTRLLFGCNLANDFAVVAGTWIFEMYDKDKDGYLNLTEARQLQVDTEPGEEEINEAQFERLCQMLGCSAANGIDVDTFIEAYLPPKGEQYGWDVSKDFAVVAGQLIAHQYDIDALGIVVPNAFSVGTGGVDRIATLEAELGALEAKLRETDAVTDPQLLSEVAAWTELAAAAVSAGPVGLAASSDDLAVGAELERWTQFASLVGDVCIESMNHRVLRNASVRSGPALSDAQIGVLSEGDVVRVLNTVELPDDEGRVCVRGQIMSIKFPDGWVTVSRGEDVLLQRVWPSASVSVEDLEAHAAAGGGASLAERLAAVTKQRNDLHARCAAAERANVPPEVAEERAAAREAVAAMENAALVTARCRERVTELQTVIDAKEKAVTEQRAAKQRLQTELDTVLSGVKSDAEATQALEANYQAALKAAKEEAELAKEEAKGQAEGAAERADLIIAEATRMLQAALKEQAEAPPEPPEQVVSLNV